MIVIVLLFGCAPPSPAAKGAPPTVSVTLTAPAFDPRLAGAPTLGLDVGIDNPGGSSCDTTLAIENSAGQVATLAPDTTGHAEWAGDDEDGVAFDVGRFVAVAVAQCSDGSLGSSSAEGWIVRLGVATVDFQDSGDGRHVPLAYHKLDVLTRVVTPIDDTTPEFHLAPFESVSDLDADDGTPRVAPPVWTNPDMPPWGRGLASATSYNVPAAYVATGHPRLAVTAGTRAISARTGGPLPAVPSDAPPLRVSAPGLTPMADGAWLVGQSLEFDADFLPGTLGRVDVPLQWTWEAYDGTDWVPVPGSSTTTHRLYQTAGTSQLRDGRALGFAPPIPWIGVLEDLEPALAGQPPDPAVVLDHIRDWLHTNEWLVYYPNDRAYSDFSGQYIYWDYSWSMLSDWLDRDDGLELYCHSLSCLYSVLAGSVGVYAPQQVLGVGFYTNLTRAAGSEEWLHWDFNSHSVVSPDDGLTLWDASVDLDGDEDPFNPPMTVLEPKGLTVAEYKYRLTYDPIDIVNGGLCYFQ